MMRFSIFILILVFPILLLAAPGHTIKYENPFSIVYGGAGTNMYGDYVSIASSVQCVDDDNNGICEYDYDGALYNARTKYENSLSTTIIPLNSSTETLSLPSDIDGKDIVYAGLYWQGNISGADEDDYDKIFSTAGGIIGRDSITMRDASGVDHNLTASKVWYHDFWGDGTGSNGGHRSFYQGYKEVTTILQNSYDINITNNYTVGNIKSTIGEDFYTYFWGDDDYAYNGVKIGFWGNWNLIVVYKHPNILALSPQPKAKNITIFQGFDALIPLGIDTTKSVSLSLSGFLTPASTPIESKMLFYGSGGEQSLAYDGFKIRDGKTTNYLDIPIEINEQTLNPTDNMFNGSVTSFGVAIDATISYYPGLDSDEFNISSAMDTLQTSTDLNLTAKNIDGTGDQIFPGLIAFSTDVYEPSFCYDYAYQQQGAYFTEDNDGFTNPRIIGDVTTGEPIVLSIFIRNYITSDLQVTDMVVNISDINTSQAGYIDPTTKIAYNGGASQDEAVTTDIDGSYINDIDIGTVDKNEYVYIYYQLNPYVSNIDMPINAVASYNLSIDGTTIPYTLSLGSDIPLCSSSNFSYNPLSGIFNVVHNDYYDYDNGGANRYYNLPTQVTKREGNFKVLSMDPDDHDTLLYDHPATVVAVEMIDVSAFHDTYASCNELASSISERVWVVLDENTTSVQFNQTALQSAIADGMTDLSTSSDFYKKARQNTAFRVSYTATDTNGSIVTLEELEGADGTKYNVTNFTTLTGLNCVSDVDNNTANTDTVVSYCSNSGTAYASAMSKPELATCMECVYGIDTRFTCSRDNFTIRPEAFMIKIDDQNQTNLASQLRIADDVSGVVVPSTIQTELAAGYNYEIEVNATNHLNNDSSIGYTKTFNTTSIDKAQYQWSPSGTPTGCNDDSNSSLSFKIVDGLINLNSFLSQVGEYTLHMDDTTWSTVDNNSVYMQHHTGTYFLPSTTPDCVFDTSVTKSVSAASTELTPQNGCNISSNHESSGSSLKYRNYDIEFHPYSFNITPTLNLGLNQNSTFVYISDIDDDENMSVQLKGIISAIGESSITPLSNFVKNCYAKPITINITKSGAQNTNLIYKYKHSDLNSSGSVIHNTTSSSIAYNASPGLITDATYFEKDMLGSLDLTTRMNFDKNISIEANPEDINFTTYSVLDSVNTFNADLVSNKFADKVKDINQSVKHYYGRTHSSRQRYEGSTGTANIYYEIYCFGSTGTNACDKTILPNGINSSRSDDLRWFINGNHTSNEGNAGTVKERSATINVTVAGQTTGNHPDNSTLMTYDESQGYPYKTTMENNSSIWLIYNKDDPTATRNHFSVEFEKAGGAWNGLEGTDTSTNDHNATITNRRSQW